MRVERKVGAGVAILGSLLLAVSGAVPALARSGPSVGLPRVTEPRFANLANGTSTTFGGWVFAPAVAATSVTAEFKVPAKLTCTSTASGIAPLTAMQRGSTTSPITSAAGVVLACQGGKPAAGAVVVLDNSQFNDTTNGLFPGDLMKGTVVMTASKTTATIADMTTGHTFTFTKSVAKGGKAVDEAIVDQALASSTTQLPVPNFGKISFSSGAVGGKPLGSVTPKGVAVNMQTRTKVLQILTGALTGTKLNAFLTTWKHS